LFEFEAQWKIGLAALMKFVSKSVKDVELLELSVQYQEMNSVRRLNPYL
jgi:hypothetical protein